MAMKMMTTLCSILAIWAVRNVDFATSHHAPSPSVNCSSLVLNMTECLTYVTNGSTVEKPEGSCCSGLKTVLKVDAECLCEAFKNSAHLGVTLNVTKAMTLPSACRISAPPVSNCGYEKSTSPPSPIPMESSTSPPSPILIAESPSSTIYGTSLLEGDLSPLNIYGGSQYEPSPSPLNIYGGSQYEPSPSPPIYGGSQYEPSPSPSPSPTIPSPTISGGSQNNKTAPSPTISGRSKNKTWLWIVLSVVGCSSVVAALVWLGCWMKRKRRENEYPTATATATATDTDSDYKSESVIVPIRQLPHNELVSTTTITSSGQLAVVLPRQFTLNELVAATNNFADEKLLGQGGFGMVYEGLFGKSKVAVKRITQKSKQGKKEYESEVKTISTLRHRNLVQLMGWCHEKYELLIVYEFMPNKSLDFHLFRKQYFLMWEKRYRITLGLASALLYLQEECEQYVLHRDIKSSNVLLDSNFNAKLGDFGLARLVDHGEMSRATLVVGTRGYMAPEYFESNKARKESDVYSFGIVALEIACGKRAIFQAKTEANDNNKLEIKLVELVWEQYGNGNVLKVADPRLGGNYDENQMERLLVVGLWCAHPDYKSRPNVKQAMDVLLSKDPLPLLPLTMPVPIFFSPSVNMSETSPTSQSQISSTGWNTTSGSHSQISSTGWNTTSGSHSQISGTGANTTLESQSRISGTGWNTSSGSQSQISSTGWNTNWLEH